MSRSGAAKTAIAEESGGDRSSYFRDYYEENREDINRRRKKRYHKDPEYRRRVLASSQRYRKKNRVATKIRLPRFSHPIAKETGDGGEVQLFSVGAFATFMARSVQAISHWEKGGVLPPTPYRDKRGHRYYTKPMMRAVKEAVGDRRRLFPVEGIYEKIEQAWKQLGVPMGARSMQAALARTSSEEPEEAEAG